MNTTPAASRSTFADLMSHPERLEAALRAARSENDAFAAGRRFGRSATSSATANAAHQSWGTLTVSNQTWPELRETEFRLSAPSAASVMLAADFTAWEKFPIDMFRNDDGVWSIVVLLLPGIYTYRFLVDGKWRDDPGAGLFTANPFGTANAVIEIT